MREHQGLTALALLAACSAQPPPSEPPAPPPPAPPAGGAGSGRVVRVAGAPELDVQRPFEGAREALAGCGDDPVSAAEQWRREGDGANAVMLHCSNFIDAGLFAPFGGPSSPWRRTWRHLNGALAACLGDPMAWPPAADPGGVRALSITEGAASWGLVLSGENRCALEGVVVLDVTRDAVDTSALTAGGLPWQQGGQVHARARLAEALRESAESLWEELPAAEQLRLLQALSEDPAAAEVTARLKKRGISAR